MPYIITIIGDPHEPRDRTAVATLDEARRVALEAVRVSDYRGEWMLPHIRATNDLATNDGGTIGPLPDGTVIEVVRAKWSTLADGFDFSGPNPGKAEAHRRILNAFNAR